MPVKRKRAQKEPHLIDFENTPAPNSKLLFAKDKRGAAALQISAKDMVTAEQNLLQPSFEHGAKDFFQLFTKPTFIIKTEKESLTKFVENDLRTPLIFLFVEREAISVWPFEQI